MKRNLKTKLALVVVVALLVGLSACGQPKSGGTTEAPTIKNVIVMISDGTSVGVSTLTRWCKAYDKESGTFDPAVRLNVDPLTSGLVRTYWENADGMLGAITDSAPGSTAISTGYKTNDKYVGVGPDGTPHATVLELAESMGKSTGLAVTVNVQHATPADFVAHTTDRSDYEDIAAQMLEGDVDVVLGGGAQYMQNRADGRDLIAELTGKGYDYLTTGAELKDCQKPKVYGLFAPDAMAYDRDRSLLAPEEPTLAEMTDKAISLLNQNEKGFFLMVEGSKVDWGAHNNDPASVVSEFTAFDEAVKTAVTFAQGRNDTMVLILEDHGTGGLSIGSAASDDTYSSYPLKDIIAPLTGAQITSRGAIELLSQGKDAVEVLKLYGIPDPTPAELQRVREIPSTPLKATNDDMAALGSMLSKRCNIGWTTVGHTGEDVVLYSYLPGNERVTGLIENTEITKIITDAWGTPLTDEACHHS